MTFHGLPEFVSPKRVEAIEVVVRDLLTELGPSLRGIVLAGSVADGTATERSDVDLFVVIALPWFQRRRFGVGGWEIDLFIDPVARIEHELAFGRSAIPIKAFATGIPLWDTESRTIARLQEKAREVYAGIPAPPSPSEQFAMQIGAQDLFRVTETGDLASRRYGAVLFLAHILDSYYLVHRRWTVPAKRTLTDLAIWAPQVRLLADKLLAAPGPDISVAAAELFQATFGHPVTDTPSISGDRVPFGIR